MSYAELINTRYGQMIVPRHDTAQTPALKATRHALCHSEIELLRSWLTVKPQMPVLLDIGSNIGSFAFGCQDLCFEVHAFEPQPLIFNMLAGSIALNGWTHVYAYNVALGSKRGEIEVPRFDFNQPMNFGGVEFGPEQREFIGQHRQEGEPDTVDLVPLDAYMFPRVDVMKIDVEGMELDVLAGADATIKLCRPHILIEHAKAGAELLRPVLEGYGYNVQPHGGMDFACAPRV